MGFDLGYADGLRDAVRGSPGQAAGGGRRVPSTSGRLADGLQPPGRFTDGLAGLQLPGEPRPRPGPTDDHRPPRIARLADGTDARSWYARSRARVATGLLLTAPGTPHAVHGPGVPRGQALVGRRPAAPTGMIWWDGARRRRPRYGRLPAAAPAT